jgi:hypothetical protein
MTMEKTDLRDEKARKRAKREARRRALGRTASADPGDAYRDIDPTRCVFRPLPDLRGR